MLKLSISIAFLLTVTNLALAKDNIKTEPIVASFVQIDPRDSVGTQYVFVKNICRQEDEIFCTATTNETWITPAGAIVVLYPQNFSLSVIGVLEKPTVLADTKAPLFFDEQPSFTKNRRFEVKNSQPVLVIDEAALQADGAFSQSWFKELISTKLFQNFWSQRLVDQALFANVMNQIKEFLKWQDKQDEQFVVLGESKLQASSIATTLQERQQILNSSVTNGVEKILSAQANEETHQWFVVKLKNLSRLENLPASSAATVESLSQFLWSAKFLGDSAELAAFEVTHPAL